MQVQKKEQLQSFKTFEKDFEEYSEEPRMAIEKTVKFSYQPIHRGQSAYLLGLCEKEGIMARSYYSEVRVYSSLKIPRFKELIGESLKAYKKPTTWKHPIHQWFIDKKLAACGIAEEDTIYTYCKVFTEIVCSQYVGQIPIPKKTILFNDYFTMAETLLKRRISIL